MAATRRCDYCGANLDVRASHCPNCGGTQTVPRSVRLDLPTVDTDAGTRKLLPPWIITHPDARRRFQSDAKAVQALVETWRFNPDVAQTIDAQAEIAAAVDRGDLTYGDSYYYCCPWSPVYDVVRKVEIDGVRLKPGQQFTFDVSAEDLAEGGRFKSEILIGDFNPTDDVDYCLIGDGGQDD